jgi:hypothetical protein
MYRSLVGKPERKRPLGGPSDKWENDMKINLKPVYWERVGWISLVSGKWQTAGCFDNGNEPSGSVNYGGNWVFQEGPCFMKVCVIKLASSTVKSPVRICMQSAVLTTANGRLHCGKRCKLSAGHVTSFCVRFGMSHSEIKLVTKVGRFFVCSGVTLVLNF